MSSFYDQLAPRCHQALYCVDEDLSTKAVAAHVMRSRYYAIGIPRLIALMHVAGFEDTARVDGMFYQPVLSGTRRG